MDQPSTSQTLSTWAVLAPKDFSFWEVALLKFHGSGGQLSLQSNALVFTPKDGNDALTIPLGDITDADFTNIIAKEQFIIKQTDGTASAFSFGSADSPSWKRMLAHQLFRPLTIYDVLRGPNIISAGQLSQQWKKVLTEVLPPNVVRQRREIRPLVVILVGLLFAGILISLLAAFIWLAPR